MLSQTQYGLEYLFFQKCNKKVYQITLTPTKTNANPQYLNIYSYEEMEVRGQK